MPRTSLALEFLASGALAFVGCTGVHYSPEGVGNYFGRPLHEAFWRSYDAGYSPASALLAAKVEYVQGIPHAQDAEEDAVAIKLKILRQFTCLGLGWP